MAGVWPQEGYTDRAETVQPTSATLDAQGQATTVLTITNQDAGDNYVVASCPFTAPSQRMAEDLFAAGHNLVAWKRIYVEEDQMYRAGADLTQDALPGHTTLVVDQIPAGVGQGTELRLFDANDPTGEHVEVESVEGTQLHLTDEITGTYREGYPALLNGDGAGAAVGVPRAGVYDANLEMLAGHVYGVDCAGTDGGCFVEFVSPTAGTNITPFRSFFASVYEMHAYRDLWFSNQGESNYI